MSTKIHKKLEEFQEFLSKETTPFSLDGPTLEERDTLGRQDVFEFGALYTPHYFTLPPAQFHRELFTMTEYRKKHLFVVTGPREFGKSILLRVAKLRMVLYGLRHYIFKISETLTLARNDIDFLVSELLFNSRIKGDFKIKILKNDDDETRLRITNKFTGRSHFVKLEPKSYGTPVVGSIFMQYRPDYAEIDDFENTKTARNQKIGEKKVDWVIEELYLAVSKDAPIVWVGNNHAKTSAINQAIENECKKVPYGSFHQFDKRSKTAHKYSAIQKTKSKRLSLWPEKMTVAELDQLKKDIGSRRFAAQMQQEPIEEGKFFKPEDVHRYDKLPDNLEWIATIDQSLGKAKTSDYKAIIIMAADTRYFYVVNAFLRQTTLRAMVDGAYYFYDMYAKKGLRVFKIENNFGQYTEISKRDFDEGANRHKFHLPISPFLNTINKEIRIEGLQPLFENGRILFPERLNKDLQELYDQLLGYPDAPHDDGPDALEAAQIFLQKRIRQRGAKNYKSLKKRRYKTRR